MTTSKTSHYCRPVEAVTALGNFAVAVECQAKTGLEDPPTRLVELVWTDDDGWVGYAPPSPTLQRPAVSGPVSQRQRPRRHRLRPGVDHSTVAAASFRVGRDGAPHRQIYATWHQPVNTTVNVTASASSTSITN